MDAVQERRRHYDVAVCSRQIVESPYRAPRIGQVFENLFADHHVELRYVPWRVAKVEVWKVQRAVRLPRPRLVLAPADLDGISSVRVENGELFTDSAVHRETNPMRFDGRGSSAARLEENPMPEPRDSDGSAPKLEHPLMVIPDPVTEPEARRVCRAARRIARCDRSPRVTVSGGRTIARPA